MSETSLSLLARIRQPQDRAAWERLAELYTPLLRQWLRAYDVQDADADDLIQEVLGVVLREVQQFDHNQRCGAFRTWLRGVLVNRLRNFWRGRQHRPIAAGGSSMVERLNALEDATSAASRQWESQHDTEMVARMLELIRPNHAPQTWDAFHRQVIAGVPAPQVALELNMSLSSVYVARSRILRRAPTRIGGYSGYLSGWVTAFYSQKLRRLEQSSSTPKN